MPRANIRGLRVKEIVRGRRSGSFPKDAGRGEDQIVAPAEATSALLNAVVVRARFHVSIVVTGMLLNWKKKRGREGKRRVALRWGGRNHVVQKSA